MKSSKTVKVCYILSYREPKYVRTKVLVGSLALMDKVEVYKAINSRKGFLRYAETLSKLIYIRVKHRPDLYILGFRGQEIFLPVRLITTGKRLIFDEFVVMYDWLVNEKKIIKNVFLTKIIYYYNRLILKLADFILEDTCASVDFSSRIFEVPKCKYVALYVGTDEKLFTSGIIKKDKKQKFNVFFYGTMLPLHGVNHIIESAKELKSKPIEFTIIGGKNQPHLVKQIKSKIYKENLHNIDYKEWVEFKDLPGYIAQADVCLGGPFGSTSQAQRVITGKTFQFLAMRKPVIIGETEEQVGFVDGVNCLLIKQGSTKALVEKIGWAYNNRGSLEAIGSNGGDMYKSRFSRSAQLPKIEALIKGS